MAKLSDISKFLNGIQTNVLSARKMKEIGEVGRDIIFDRTKAGFGVTKESTGRTPSKRTLKRLANGRRSTLTDKDKMLKSLRVEARRGQFEITPSNNVRKGGKTNKQISGFVSVERPYLAFTGQEIQQVVEELEKAIEKEFNRAFK